MRQGGRSPFDPPPDPADQSPLPDIAWTGEHHILLSFGNAISAEVQDRVHAACQRISRAQIPGLCDIVPAYTTILLGFDPLAAALADPQHALRAALATRPGDSEPAPALRTVEIPVCYDPALAPDLEEVARLRDLSPGQVVALHSGATYRVGFIGFMPGFAYLHGLPATLATPRLATPRPRVPEGSVGIAGDQTGVYPSATPGGWRLIGRTPLRIFDARRDRPALLAMGDQVRFTPITRAQFDRLALTPTGAS